MLIYYLLDHQPIAAPFLIASGHTELFWPQWLEMIRVFVAPILWVLIISTIALSRIHALHWLKTLTFNLGAMIPMAGILAVFIR